MWRSSNSRSLSGSVAAERASSSSAGRRRLPTWSARYCVAIVLAFMTIYRVGDHQRKLFCQKQFGIRTCRTSEFAQRDMTVQSSLVERQADVVLSEGRHTGDRTCDVIEFRQLPAVIKPIGTRKEMQHGGHPPGEALHIPNSAQTFERVFVEQIVAAGFVECFERSRQHTHVREGQIQALGASGRNDVSRVARQKEAAELHRFNHEAAHPDQVFLKDETDRRSPALPGPGARV